MALVPMVLEQTSKGERNFMSAEQALMYGLVDQVINKRDQ